MIVMYTERVNRLPRGVKQRSLAINSVSKWRGNLKAAQEEVVRLEKETEENKNVQSTSEEEAIG